MVTLRPTDTTMSRGTSCGARFTRTLPAHGMCPLISAWGWTARASRGSWRCAKLSLEKKRGAGLCSAIPSNCASWPPARAWLGKRESLGQEGNIAGVVLSRVEKLECARGPSQKFSWRSRREHCRRTDARTHTVVPLSIAASLDVSTHWHQK